MLQLGGGISPAMARASADTSNNITLTIGTSGDQVKIDSLLAGSSYGIQQVQFADGTAWSRTQVVNLSKMGTPGNDTITGTSSSDVFDGRGGNDTITGGGGADTYLFRPGYGTLIINNGVSGGTAPQGELDFTPDLDKTDLWFAQSANDLVIEVLGTQSSTTIHDWFGGNSSSALAAIKGGDGWVIDSQVQQLVSAMANFQASNPGFNLVTSTQMPNDISLQNAIAAAWHR